MAIILGVFGWIIYAFKDVWVKEAGVGRANAA
jgi:hypothetical protein